MKTAREAQGLIGRSVQVPGQDAKPEDWDKFLTTVSGKLPADRRAPEKAEGYEFKLPDGIPKEMPYDAEFAASFKPIAHQLGLTSKQAGALHDFYVNAAAKVFATNAEQVTATTQAAEKALAEQAVTATQTLEKAFGKRDSDEFKKAVEITGRTVRELGGEELLKELTEMKVLDAEGLILKPAFAIAFHKAGMALFKEDSLERGSGANGGDNPFTDGPAGGNMTEQHKLIREDRTRAVGLIRAAGRKPSEWGLPD